MPTTPKVETPVAPPHNAATQPLPTKPAGTIPAAQLATEPAKAPPPSEPVAKAPVVVTPAVPEKAATAQPAASVAFPNLKVQGIFYRLKNPSALINGRTFGLGDTVEGAKIVEINRQTVVVEMSGARKTLAIP
jgi:hypothetical protein